MNVQCPHCHVRIAYNGGRVGQTASCPRCRRPFQFPAATQSPPAPASGVRPDLAFSDDPEPAYGGGSKEPWFYGFLETYAKVWMWLGITSVVFLVVLQLGVTIYAMGSWSGVSKIGGGEVALLLCQFLFSVLLYLFILLAIIFWTALLLLAVDIGRTLRGIHRNVRP